MEGPLQKIAIVAASLVLAACATPEQELAAHLDGNLDMMIGQPVDVAVGRLGEPSGAARIGSDTVYSWQQAFESTVTTTPLGIGSPPGVYAPIKSSSSHTERVNNQCLLQAVVSPSGLIRYWHFEGNYAGCEPYAERLVPLARAGTE
jgi:hypothetical protein